MPFIEVLRLAFAALSANKLRSGLTMLGITIGVFSVISVMTATGALQGSIETGLSFLGSNIFQFSKYPALGGGGPQAASKYANRRDVTYEQAMVYKRLMADTGAVISLKVFDSDKRVTYGKLRTNPNITIVGTNENFLVSNRYTIAEGRNLNEADVDLARSRGGHRHRHPATDFPGGRPHRQAHQDQRQEFHGRSACSRKKAALRRQPGYVHSGPDHPFFRELRPSPTAP